MSYHQFQIFEKVGTEESQINTSIELSERVNLFMKQNSLRFRGDYYINQKIFVRSLIDMLYIQLTG